MKILENAGNGTGSAYELRAGGRMVKENVRSIYAYGTWDGAAVTIEVSPDGGTTWIEIPSLSFTADSVYNIEARASHIRAVVAGGTAPSLTVMVL